MWDNGDTVSARTDVPEFWDELKGNQLWHRFSRQIPIDEYIVDFYSKELNLAIEVDGDSHYHDDQPERDSTRQSRLESLGVKFIRFDDIDVKQNRNWVLNEIVNWIEINEPTPTPPRRG